MRQSMNRDPYPDPVMIRKGNLQTIDRDADLDPNIAISLDRDPNANPAPAFDPDTDKNPFIIRRSECRSIICYDKDPVDFLEKEPDSDQTDIESGINRILNIHKANFTAFFFKYFRCSGSHS